LFQSARRRWNAATLRRFRSPLKSDDKVAGALTNYADDPGKFNERIIELLQEWSDLFALKVMTLRSREQRDGSDTALKAREKELQQMIDAVPQHIGMLSPDGRPLFANKIALEYHGLTLKEWPGLDHARRFVHPDDLEKVLREHKQGIASEKPYEFEVRLRSKSGQYRQFLYRANPLRDDQGRIIRWYSTQTDIEDRKQAEDRLRLLSTQLPR